MYEPNPLKAPDIYIQSIEKILENYTVEYKIDYEEQQKKKERAKQMRILKMRSRMGKTSGFEASEDFFNQNPPTAESVNDLSHLNESRDYN
jgi:allantoicase